MMKHRMKNFLMVLLAAFLAIGSVQTQTITSFAEESKGAGTPPDFIDCLNPQEC